MSPDCGGSVVDWLQPVEHNPSLRFLRRQCQITFSNTLMEAAVLALKTVGLPLLTRERQCWWHVQKKHDVRSKSKGGSTIDGPYRVKRHTPTVSLVRKTRGSVSVAHNNRTPLQCRENDLASQLCPCGSEKEQLRAWSHGNITVPDERPSQLLANGGAAGLVCNNQLAAALSESLGKSLDLGTLAGPFAAFKYDKGTHATNVGRGLRLPVSADRGPLYLSHR